VQVHFIFSDKPYGILVTAAGEVKQQDKVHVMCPDLSVIFE
jgi:hypothetical protein